MQGIKDSQYSFSCVGTITTKLGTTTHAVAVPLGKVTAPHVKLLDVDGNTFLEFQEGTPFKISLAQVLYCPLSLLMSCSHYAVRTTVV